MNCKLDRVLLQDLLEDIIDPVEKLVVEEHLKICKECRKELTELKLLFWDLNNKSNLRDNPSCRSRPNKRCHLGKSRRQSFPKHNQDHFEHTTQKYPGIRNIPGLCARC